jgi:hypothetical protein
MTSGSALPPHPLNDFRAGLISRLQSFDNLQASEFACHPGRSHRWHPMVVPGRPWRCIRAERGSLPCRASDVASRPNRAIDGRGLSPPRSAALLAAPVMGRPRKSSPVLHLCVRSTLNYRPAPGAPANFRLCATKRPEHLQQGPFTESPLTRSDGQLFSRPVAAASR